MDDVKVSVLIYVLNDVQHIEKCVCSVMAQTLNEIEIIIIDGGSNDGTAEIVSQMAMQDTRIRILNGCCGVGMQFNTGLKAARGKYIGICESDDYLLPDMYEMQYSIAEKYRLDILKADVRRFCEVNQKEILVPFSYINDNRLYNVVINPKEDIRYLKTGVNGFWSGLYRREFLLGQHILMNETKGASYQDISISFMAGVKAERVMIINQAFYCYRMDNPNSSVNNPRKLTMLIEEYKLLKQRLKQEGLFEKYKEIYLSWKVNGHLWFYDNLLTELKKQYSQLLYEDIQEELQSEEYKKSELSIVEHQLVSQVQRSSGDVWMYLKKQDENIEYMIQQLRCIPQERKVIIFGSGNLGRIVVKYLKATERTAAFFADNNYQIWQEEIEGLVVVSPQKAVQDCLDGIYIIANAKHFEEMKQQLLQLHIPENNIIVCNHYDIFLKKVLIKTLKEKEISD